MVKKCALFPYADYHQLPHAAETIKEVEPILNEEGNKVSQWYDKNLLKGNFSKYQNQSLWLKTKEQESQNIENRGGLRASSPGAPGGTGVGKGRGEREPALTSRKFKYLRPRTGWEMLMGYFLIRR